MSEARQILERIIDDFEVEKFVRFFREKSRSFSGRQEDLTQYNRDNFTDGKSITISSKVNKKKDLDVVIGLALHEGSHILEFDGKPAWKSWTER